MQVSSLEFSTENQDDNRILPDIGGTRDSDFRGNQCCELDEYSDAELSGADY